MKKIIFIILALSLMLTGLLGCDGEKKTEATLTTAGASNGDLPSNETTEPSSGDLPSNETTAPDPEEDDTPSTKAPADIVRELEADAVHFSATVGCVEAILRETSKDTALKAFLDEDFERVDVDLIDGAKFETLVLSRKFDVVTMYWSEAEGELRVLWEKTSKNGLYMLEPNDKTGTGTVSVAQVGIEREKENDNPQIGMCYIIKLSSGKAIIIDGGFDTEACADNIYNTLERMNISKSSGKYGIEAWIITHRHKDHFGAYQMFSSRYASKVKVDHIITAYPGSESLVVGSTGNFSAGAFSYAKQINPHSGIKYYFGNATISMLYTPDMAYSSEAKIDYFNDTSLVFKIEAGGSEVLFMGDAGEGAAEEMLESYELSAFKSDLFQFPHHGLYTSADSGHKWTELKKLYDAIDPDSVLLSMNSRLAGNSRNGRYSVLVGWARNGYQISYVVNAKDDHGLSNISQEYFDSFAESVANGTNTRETLYGYNGINKLVNEKGLVTYLGSAETTPMITVFELKDGNAVLETNKLLYDWLENK